MDNTNHDEDSNLKLLIKNEELLSELYKKYMGIFPDDTEFWAEISKDEMVHAMWVDELQKRVIRGEVHISQDRFNLEVLVNFGRYVEEKTSSANTDVPSAINALSIAMDIENSMLEKDMFRIYETDSADLKIVLDKLRVSTEIHYAEVKNRWEQERSKNPDSTN